MNVKQLATCILVILLFSAISAFADEGLAGFGHVATENAAPATSIGIPGTVTGDFANRTQLTGDWGGKRTEFARKGFFFDMYSTSTYQKVTSGGLKTGESFVQNNQISVNVDTARAGLWSGGLLHFTLQSRYGSSPEDTFTAGASVPQYTGLAVPGPLFSNNTLPSEYFVVQGLSKEVSIVVGKISDIFIPDQTMMGDSYKYYFANFNFNKNPITVNFYNPTAWAALGVWAPSKTLAIAGGVLDPNSSSNNFASHAFDKVNLYLTSVSSYNIGGLPGQFSPAFNWSNKAKTNLKSPYGQLSPAQIPEAVGGLLGASTVGLPINTKDKNWFALANVSQYLYVKDTPDEISEKLKSGQVLRGVGVFARLGYAPEDANPVTRDGSVALFAHGIFDSRPYDSFGVGVYYNAISGDLKNNIARLTAGTESVKNEKGVEAFYDFAITPAIRLIASYQHIANPLVAQVVTKQDQANLFLTRLNIAW